MEAIHEHVSHMPRFARFLSITDILNQMGEQDEEMNRVADGCKKRVPFRDKHVQWNDPNLPISPLREGGKKNFRSM
jgi:hypothetical protein